MTKRAVRCLAVYRSLEIRSWQIDWKNANRYVIVSYDQYRRGLHIASKQLTKNICKVQIILTYGTLYTYIDVGPSRDGTGSVSLTCDPTRLRVF